jgi:hypothetical protein
MRVAFVEDADFFHKQADWCYQLAWRSSDLDGAEAQPNGQRAYDQARTLQGTDETPRAETNQSKKRGDAAFHWRAEL